MSGFKADPLYALTKLLEEQRRTTILLCGRVYDVAGMTLNGHRFVFQSHESEGGSTGETAQGYHYEVDNLPLEEWDRYKYESQQMRRLWRVQRRMAQGLRQRFSAVHGRRKNVKNGIVRTPNKENIQKWVEALRSGKYVQATGALHMGDGFCCLGVACEISGKGWWRGLYYETNGGDENKSVLPKDVVDWLGVEDDNPTIVREEFSSTSLAELNDGGATFEEIAVVIEKTYLTA
jgi:hypothetical protein